MTTRFSQLISMAEQDSSALQKIRDYVKESREQQADAMEFDASNMEARLEETVKELQTRVQEQQAALEKA
jgi:hypothetical protein